MIKGTTFFIISTSPLIPDDNLSIHFKKKYINT